ncbi:MAG: PAS domain-containing protein, partial [Rhodobiaceae bacterium]|nr:PAS domain-containing protein [Rhodobiaceae bacterium]
MAPRARRGGGLVAVLILAVLFIAVAVALAILPKSQATPLVFALLGVLSVIGVFSLFAASVGILRFRSEAQPNALSDAIVNTFDAAMALVDDTDRIIWANRAYLTLAGAQSAASAPLPGKLYSGNPEMAEATYRLSKAARDRRFHFEEVRIGGTGDDEEASDAIWLRIRTWPLQKVEGSGRRRKMSVWQIDDITSDRERQESVFQELQHAIDFLDHAPAGFFSATPDGRIGYMNATLAGWLDVDLGETTNG